MIWEYKVVKGWLSEDELNQLGASEWELVIADFSHKDNIADFFYFKRPYEDYEDDEDDEGLEE